MHNARKHTTYAQVHTADRGYWCVSCADADERQCDEYCPNYRWESGSCLYGCKLPSTGNFGRNTAVGTCTAGGTLAAGKSCKVRRGGGEGGGVRDGERRDWQRTCPSRPSC